MIILRGKLSIGRGFKSLPGLLVDLAYELDTAILRNYMMAIGTSTLLLKRAMPPVPWHVTPRVIRSSVY